MIFTWGIIKNAKRFRKLLKKLYPFNVERVSTYDVLDINNPKFDPNIAVPTWIKYTNIMSIVKGENLATEKKAYLDSRKRNLLKNVTDFSNTGLTSPYIWSGLSRGTNGEGPLPGTVSKTTTIAWADVSQIVNVKANKTYTFSAYVKCSTAGTASIFINNGSSGSPTVTTTNSKSLSLTGDGEWTRYHHTFTTVMDGDIKPRVQFGQAVPLTVACLQLEEGIAPTDWDSGIDIGGAALDNVLNKLVSDKEKIQKTLHKLVTYTNGNDLTTDSNIMKYMDAINKSDFTKVSAWFDTEYDKVDTDFTAKEEYDIIKTYPFSRKVRGNPLMGYLQSSRRSSVEPEVELVYLALKWNEIQSNDANTYDWEAWENANRYNEHKAAGRHAVLRMVMDTPSSTPHTDLPQWLHDKHGTNLGAEYNTRYGQGFSPDYTYEPFYRDYLVFMNKIKERYKDDPFISYIQLGVVGHWGELHVNYGEGVKKLPLWPELKKWFDPWINGFPNAIVMMRRPFIVAKENNWGLYNDMIGNVLSTSTWLDWMVNGAKYDQTGETGVIVPYPDPWKVAPMGGEFTSSTPMDTMLITDKEITLGDLKKSHTTFVGQKYPDKTTHEDGYWAVLDTIGYKLYIPKVRLTKTASEHKIEITWTNKGIAPMYFNWPVKLYVIDFFGKVKEEITVDVKLKTILPEETVTSVTNLTNYTHGVDRLSLGIIDPLDNKPKVKINIEGQENNRRPNLF